VERVRAVVVAVAAESDDKIVSADGDEDAPARSTFAAASSQRKGKGLRGEGGTSGGYDGKGKGGASSASASSPSSSSSSGLEGKAALSPVATFAHRFARANARLHIDSRVLCTNRDRPRSSSPCHLPPQSQAMLPRTRTRLTLTPPRVLSFSPQPTPCSPKQGSGARPVADVCWSLHRPEALAACLGAQTSSSSSSLAPSPPLGGALGASDGDGGGGAVLLWSLALASSPERELTCHSPVLKACFAPDSPHLLVGGTYSGQVGTREGSALSTTTCVTS